MKKIKIGKYTLQNYGEPFIVAEAGINHNGILRNAIKMIDIAKDAGCNAIKFQTFKADEIVQDKNLDFTYLSQGKKIKENMNKMFKRYELNKNDWKKISDYSKKKKIIFFSTPQNLSDLKILLKYNIPAIKVGSDDFTNISLIQKYLSFNKPVILSTGMSTSKDFDRVLKITNINKYKLIYLLCTSEYPTNHKNVNINKFISIKKKIKKNLIGFSDHTIDDTASIMAVANGCCFFEKHFTLSKKLAGPDHWFSLDPLELKKWVNSIRDAYKCMGYKNLKPTKIEIKNKQSFQRKIIANKLILKGQIIKLDDIKILRSSNKKALNSSLIKKVLGKVSKHTINKNDPIKL